MPSLAPSLPCLPGLPAPAASWHASLHRMLSLNADVVGVTVMMFLMHQLLQQKPDKRYTDLQQRATLSSKDACVL